MTELEIKRHRKRYLEADYILITDTLSRVVLSKKTSGTYHIVELDVKNDSVKAAFMTEEQFREFIG
ncbi:hypothetical protein ACQCN2_09440 [Brevibacillus ginsengisoli]|uniref:hypothetical protein n=1 Tax=Brevibacillus ginsengisoli TaxID=363854 RepID=UPI003CF8820D